MPNVIKLTKLQTRITYNQPQFTNRYYISSQVKLATLNITVYGINLFNNASS